MSNAVEIFVVDNWTDSVNLLSEKVDFQIKKDKFFSFSKTEIKRDEKTSVLREKEVFQSSLQVKLGKFKGPTSSSLKVGFSVVGGGFLVLIALGGFLH